jgi:transposase-like protein
MEQDDEPLSGEVEVDETWIGGKLGNNPKYRNVMSPFANKTAVAGAVQRGGRVIAVTVPNIRKGTLIGNVQRRVLPASTIYSDESKSYTGLPKHGYAHKRVNHSENIYVSGEVHVNTMEGFWSLVKRGIDGVYHSVSAKHLQGYLNEYAWRYNHRHSARTMFETLLLRSVGS